MKYLEEHKIGMSVVKAAFTDPDSLLRLIVKEGEIFTFKFFGTRGYIFANPIYIQHVLSHKPDYIRIIRTTKPFRRMVGNYGLLVCDFDIWKKDREILNALFTKDKLKDYDNIMIKQTAHQFTTWASMAERKEPINIEKYFADLTLNNLLQTIFGGVKIENRDILDIIHELFYLTFLPFVKFFGRIPRYIRAKKKFRKVGDDIVQQCFTKKVSENNLIKHLAKAYGHTAVETLDHHMKEHLHSEALTFLVAGFETTAALLTHISVYLSLYPLIAESLYKEIETVIGSREPVYEDLSNLPWARAIVQETLRLWAPAPFLIRTPVDDDMVEGHLVKKNNIVFIPIHAIQRHPDYWPNPVGFDPKRFLSPLTEEQKILYMPFGQGPQSCIGSQFGIRETMLVLAMLVQRFRLTLVPGTSIKRVQGLVNRMGGSIMMKVNFI
jgi:cytochrome P450